MRGLRLRKRLAPVVAPGVSARARRELAARQGMLALGAVAALHGAAHASSATATLNINATITSQCFISNTSLSFGAFGAFSGSSLAANTASATAAIPIACTNGWPATIYASLSSVTLTGTTAIANTLVAALASNSAGGTPFPTAAASGLSYTGTGASGTQNIYGQIITSPTTKVDTYTGSAILTIAY